MNREPKISRDGVLDFLGGVDSSRSPSLISANQAAWAGNVSFRDGYAKTRPRFFQTALSYASVEQAEWIETHAVQGAYIFAPRYRTSVIVASIGGRIFEIDVVNDFAVKEITPHSMTATAGAFTSPAVGDDETVSVDNAGVVPVGLPLEINGDQYLVVSISGNILTLTNLTAAPGVVVASGATVMALDPNSPSLGRAWMQQAELFLIIQDGQKRAIIYDGSKSYRSDITKQQVPTGTVMAYWNGRLWVAINQREYVAGDIVGGEKHNPDYQSLDNVLYFKENTFLAGGGAFTVPMHSGDITAMVVMPVLDTSTGNGNLLIGTERAVFSCNASPDRDTWQKSNSPLQTIVMIGNGPVGQYSVAQTTNSDILYRARDGVRSFYLAMRQFTNSWGNTPNSTEMDRVLPFDDLLLLKYGSMIQFDNRLLFTVQPMPTLENAYHRGLGVLDFNLISSMRGKAPPVYEGIWTGFQPVLLFKGDIGGRERAFSWARNAAGNNELWEFGNTSGFDNTDARVPSFIETRSMFGREPTASPLSLKRLESVELYVDQIVGQVDFVLYYKPDQYPCWLPWGLDQEVCSVYQECADDTDPLCVAPVVKRPTFRTRLNFGQPLDEDQDVDDKPARIGYEFQLRLGWTGHCRIRKLLVRFTERDDEMFPPVYPLASSSTNGNGSLNRITENGELRLTEDGEERITE